MVRKQKAKFSMLRGSCWKDFCELVDYDFMQDIHGQGYLGNIFVQLFLKERILLDQEKDAWIQKRKDDVHLGTVSTGEWKIGDDGGVWLNGRLVVPGSQGLKEKIMNEAHKMRYSVLPGETN